jgi:competence protein ComGC
VRSYWDRSLKQDIALLAVYNPITIGAMAAMAIPAFQKVRVASQEKAILNNLRILSSAADQYYLEHDTKSATYDDLVGPGKYVSKIISVMGEDYSHMLFVQDRPLRIRLPNGKVLQYPLGPQPMSR